MRCALNVLLMVQCHFVVSIDSFLSFQICFALTKRKQHKTKKNEQNNIKQNQLVQMPKKKIVIENIKSP